MKQIKLLEIPSKNKDEIEAISNRLSSAWNALTDSNHDRVRPGYALNRVVTRLLSQGVSEEEMLYSLAWASRDSYYQERFLLIFETGGHPLRGGGVTRDHFAALSVKAGIIVPDFAEKLKKSGLLDLMLKNGCVLREYGWNEEKRTL